MFVFLAASLALAGTIQVEMSGFRTDDGTVRVALHNVADAYPTDFTRAVGGKTGPVTKGVAILTFEDVDPGTYALSVHHDENDNDKFDMKFFVIPKEGTGASNNAKGKMGPPRFEDAAFEVGDTPVTQQIEIIYY